MFVQLAQSLQSYVSQYPSVLQYVGKAVTWVGRQAFAPELAQLWNRVSFTVNIGDSPELNVRNFVVTKTSGTNKVYGSSANQTNFELTLDGLVASAKAKLTSKKSEAASKLAVARQKADEAKRLADEAARLAELAESEASSFESAFRGVSSFARA